MAAIAALNLRQLFLRLSRHVWAASITWTGTALWAMVTQGLLPRLWDHVSSLFKRKNSLPPSGWTMTPSFVAPTRKNPELTSDIAV
jgi:hypothetical protein